MSAPAIPKVSFSAREAATTYGVSADHIYNLIKGGFLAAKRSGTKLLIPREELERWFESLPDA